jgi:hypothetical protein
MPIFAIREVRTWHVTARTEADAKAKWDPDSEPDSSDFDGIERVE